MSISYLDGKRLKRILYASTKWLVANEKVLNDINVFPVPDGDTGTNMGATLKHVIKSLPENSAENDLPNIASIMAQAALFGARGNSGVILSQILKGFSDSIGDKKKLNALDIAYGLKNAYERAYQSISQPKEGTILTVVRDSVNAAYEKAKTEPAIDIVIETLLHEAKKSLLNTPNLLPVLKEAGVVDAGALGFVYFVEGIYMLLKGHNLPEMDFQEEFPLKRNENISTVLSHFYGYCTEFLLHPATTVSSETLRTTLSPLGDSIVVAGADTVYKVHIHSRSPGKILEECLAYGILTDIKIENMDDQHARIEKNIVEKETVFIAVALGEGVKKIFESLGCDFIIQCGQTMNPSVEEIANACAKFQAKNYIILPNDSNVIFTAEQCAGLHRDKNIIIVPTKSIPEGFAALLAFNGEATMDENIHAMHLSMKRVKSGEITKAVKSTTIGELSISKEDIIAVYNNKIIDRFSDVQTAITGLIETMKDKDSEIISLFYSEDIGEAEARAVENTLKGIYQNFEIEVHHGGQPHFSFIISIE